VVGILAAVAVHLGRPRNDFQGLDALAPLWNELHRRHCEVADYKGLVTDLDVSWTSRLPWYGRLLSSGAWYVTAGTDEGV
jgi:hypothetical protein